MARFSKVDALPFVEGVDRSPTEVAALFLAENPTTASVSDAVEFLVEALGVPETEARDAVSLIPGVDASPAIPAVSKDALLARAAELGVEVKGNWGAPKLAEAIAAAEQALADAAAAAAAQAADGGTPANGSDDGTQPTV